MHAYAFVIAGFASWYSRSSSGDTMANGQPMNDHLHTCAMRSHRFGERLRIVADNHKESWCILSDYGPAEWTGRVIDVSPAVKADLDFDGTIRVRVYREVRPPPRGSITPRFLCASQSRGAFSLENHPC